MSKKMQLIVVLVPSSSSSLNLTMLYALCHVWRNHNHRDTEGVNCFMDFTSQLIEYQYLIAGD